MIRYVLFLICFLPIHAFACTNPAGEEGEQFYNATENVMTFCNGTNWVRMDGQGDDQLWQAGNDMIFYQTTPAAVGTNTMNPADQDLLVDGRALAASLAAAPVNDNSTSVTRGTVQDAIVMVVDDDAGRNAIASPVTGQIVFNISSNTLELFNGSQWMRVPTLGLSTVPRSCAEVLAANPAAVDGVYQIDGDGPGGTAPFDVYCDMTTDGGGWTLVDNNTAGSACFTSRQAGANTDINVTRGSYLPAYTWSEYPQLLVKSNNFTGSVGWVTFAALTSRAQEYPTATTETTAAEGQWGADDLNGNTHQGINDWIYNGGGNFGSVWIGYGSQPTAACCYHAAGQTGLGTYNSNVANSCSTWVR